MAKEIENREHLYTGIRWHTLAANSVSCKRSRGPEHCSGDGSLLSRQSDDGEHSAAASAADRCRNGFMRT